MKINYVAYDGKIFDNEEECLEYENKNNKKSIKENLISLDKNLHPLDYDNLNFESEVYFILAKNNFVCELLETKFSESWVDTPAEGFQPNVAYWWDDADVMWVNAQEELKELKEKVKFFEDILAIK